MKVYAKGLNFMGQLAQGNYDSLNHFQSISYLEGIPIKQLQAHLTHSYALLEDNQLLHWGWMLDSLTSARVLSFYKKSPPFMKWWQKNSFFGDTIGMRTGTKSPILLNKQVLEYPINKFTVGGSYILTLMTDGNVLGLGDNYKGQLGMGDIKYRFCLEKLPVPSKEKIVDISCGYQHSLLVTESGRVYGSGRSNHFQICNTKSSHQIYTDNYEQLQIMEIPNDQVVKVSAGFNHTLLFTAKQQLYSIGLNLYGQCGLNNLDDNLVKTFTHVYVDLDKDESILQIVSGQAHNLLLTSKNRLIFFGNREHNQMATQSQFQFEQSGPIELKLPLNPDESITKIYANFDRSAVLTSSGDCIIWGGEDQSYYNIPYYPTFTRLKSELGYECKIKDIALGYGHILLSVVS